MALHAYRHVLRSARLAFQGDTRMYLAARAQLRREFESRRDLPPDTSDAQEAVQHAEEVARVLRQNVVQGAASVEGGRYRLRIHEETEKGDNESVKMGRVEGRRETDLSGKGRAWGAG